jgi:hypothetical protein
VLSFALSFAFEPRAAEAARVLRSEGYEVELQQQPDGSAVVIAVPAAAVASPEALMPRMHALAESLGGEALGYGGTAAHGLG